MKNEELEKVQPELKSQNQGYSFAKKLGAAIAALAMSASMIFGLAACNDKTNTPVDPVNPNPPVVDPIEPVDPDKPTPPKPDDEELKKFNAAVTAANEFIANALHAENFTNEEKGVTYEYADGETKVTANDNVHYYYAKNNVSYKVYNDGEAWREVEEENPRDYADALDKFNNITWDKLDNGTLTGHRNQTNTINFKLANGIASYSYNGTSGTITEVGTTNFEIPEITPEQEPIDWDNLTDEQLAEFTPVMVENIKTTLAKNIQRNIGNTGVLNNIFAIDFDGNNLILGLNYTNSSSGNKLELASFELNNVANYENIYKNEFSPTKSNGAGEMLISFNYNTYSADDVSRVQQCFAKLANDGLVNNLQEENDFWHMITRGTAVDTTLKCGATGLSLYNINSNKITYIELNIKSDGNTKDFIKDHLLNGTLNKTYRKLNEIEYNFTDKALYNFDGLEKSVSQESEN